MVNKKYWLMVYMEYILFELNLNKMVKTLEDSTAKWINKNIDRILTSNDEESGIKIIDPIYFKGVEDRLVFKAQELDQEDIRCLRLGLKVFDPSPYRPLHFEKDSCHPKISAQTPTGIDSIRMIVSRLEAHFESHILILDLVRDWHGESAFILRYKYRNYRREPITLSLINYIRVIEGLYKYSKKAAKRS
jgi:hypothetical protein